MPDTRSLAEIVRTADVKVDYVEAGNFRHRDIREPLAELLEASAAQSNALDEMTVSFGCWCSAAALQGEEAQCAVCVAMRRYDAASAGFAKALGAKP